MGHELQLDYSIFPRLKQNVDHIETILGNSTDLEKREFFILENENLEAALFFIDGLVDSDQLQQSIMTPLLNNSQTKHYMDDGKLSSQMIVEILTKRLLLLPSSTKMVTTFQQLIDELLAGSSILLVDHCEQGFILQAQGWESRGIEEPQAEVGIRGPRDGFVESIRVNTALVRRRIREPDVSASILKNRGKIENGRCYCIY